MKLSVLSRGPLSRLPWVRHSWENSLAAACGPESLSRYRWYVSGTTLVGGFRDPADPGVIRAPYWSITFHDRGRFRRGGKIAVDRKGHLTIRHCSFSGPHVEDERFSDWEPGDFG